MKKSHAVFLAGVAAFVFTSSASVAQVGRSGEQCRPAVANPEMYGKCRLRIVQGNEVCRCAILPQAVRRVMDRLDGDSLATGSIGATPRADVAEFGRSSAGAVAANAGSESGMAAASGVGGTGSGAGNSPAGGATASGAAAGTGSGGLGGSPGNSGNAPGHGGANAGNGQGPGNNNGLGNGSEPADNSSTDVKGTDPSNPGGGNGGGRGGRGGNDR